MKKLLFSIIITLLTNTLLMSQTTEPAKKENDKGISAGMAVAWVSFNNEQYYDALRTYKKLYKKAPGNAQLNYRIGLCFVELKQMDTAIFHLEKALSIDTTINSKVYYALGRAYQYNGDLDKAIDNYYKYKSTLSPKQNERHFVNVYLRQCLTAKEMMANPVNVKIRNLGKAINSKYVDAAPSITADGKTLIFTSRRKENIGGKIDPATEDYYDDVWVSHWNDETKTWGKAENIGKPINTEFYDGNLSISPDGNMIFVYRNQLNVTKSGDIYVSKKKSDGTWGRPRNIDDKYINTSYFESSACITADGKTLYFVSERQRGGLGQGDIYKAEKEGRHWGKPVNLGPVINTPDDEIGVYIHPDGKTLFFSSNGHNTMGMHDIFVSHMDENGNWSKPVNLGYPINTTKDEIHFVLTTDRKTAYISSTREGGFGKNDIYAVDMSRYFKSNENLSKDLAQKISGPPLCILKGAIIDSKTSQPIKTSIIVKNLSTNKTKIVYANEKGEYFVTLPAGYKYSLTAKSKGYKPMTIKVKLPKNESETPTVVKHILLDKK